MVEKVVKPPTTYRGSAIRKDWRPESPVIGAFFAAMRGSNPYLRPRYGYCAGRLLLRRRLKKKISMEYFGKKESGVLAPDCTIEFTPSRDPQVNTSYEVITFRGKVIVKSRGGHLRDSEVAKAVKDVRTFLATEKLFRKLGHTFPEWKETYTIPGVGSLTVTAGFSTFVKGQSGIRRYDSDGELYFEAPKGHFHTERYAIPSIWVADRFGQWGRMDSDKALSLIEKAAE